MSFFLDKENLNNHHDKVSRLFSRGVKPIIHLFGRENEGKWGKEMLKGRTTGGNVETWKKSRKNKQRVVNRNDRKFNFIKLVIIE